MKKGLKPLISGIVIFVFGVFIVPVSIILPLILSNSSAMQFLIPGTTELSVEAPGRYYLWNDHQTIFKGRSYNRSVDLPDGLMISIRDSTQQVLDFVSDASISWESGNLSKQSIGYVEVVEPRALTIEVIGDESARVFSFEQSKLLKMFGLIFFGVGLSLVFAMLGVIVAVIGIVKLAQGD